MNTFFLWTVWNYTRQKKGLPCQTDANSHDFSVPDLILINKSSLNFYSICTEKSENIRSNTVTYEKKPGGEIIENSVINPISYI